MLKKSFQVASCVAMSLVLIISLLFTGVSAAKAISTGEGESVNDPFGISIEPSIEAEENEKVVMDEMSMEDIFGSEQVFPFEAGFGGKSDDN